METILFRLKLEGSEVIIRNQAELEKVLSQSRKELKGLTDTGTKGYKQLAKDVGTLEAIQQEFREEQKRTRAEVISSNRAQQGSYNQLKAELETLNIAYRQLGTEGLKSTKGKEIIANLQRVKAEFDSLRNTAGEGLFNNFDRALSGAVSTFAASSLGDIASIAGALGASGPIAASFEFLGQGLDVLDQMGQRIEELRGRVQQLTGATGETLTEATARFQALAETFGADPKELLLAANALTEQLTGNLGESIDLIEAGFLAGADANNEYLDSLREYPAFFREARLSGSQFISVISQGVDQGIFSDKAVDLIKEFEIRVRELPKSTVEALKSIGITSQEIAAVIDEKGIGGAFTLVQEKLQKFADDSPQVGKALADIFGGPGEDSGIQFVKTLDLAKDSLDDLIDPTNLLVSRQQQQLEVSRELSLAQQELVSVTQPFISNLSTFATQVLTEVIRGISTFLEVLRLAPQFIRDNRVELLLLAGAAAFYNQALIASTLLSVKDNAVKLISAARTRALAAQQAILNAVMSANPIGIVVLALTAFGVALAQAYKRSETFRASIDGIGAVAKEFFSIMKEALGSFLEGFSQLKEGNIKGAISAFGSAIAKGNPVSLAFNQGGRLAKAYRDGYQSSLNKSAQDNAQETESALVGNVKGITGKLAEEGAKGGKTTAQSVMDAFNSQLKKDSFDTGPVAGSVEALRSEIQKLNTEVSSGNLDDTQLRQRLQEIVDKEKELENLELRIKQVKAQLSGDIQLPKVKALEDLDVARLKELKSLAERNLSYEEYQKARTEITDRYELARLETEKRFAKEGSKEYLSILDDQTTKGIEAKQRQNEAVKNELRKALDTQIAELETARLEELKSLSGRNLSYEEYQKARTEITERYELARLDIELMFAEAGSNEYLSILDSRHLKELEAEQRTTDAVTAQRQRRLQQISQYVQEGIGLFQQLADSQFDIQRQEIEQESEARLAALEAEREQRLIGVESGSLEEQRLNQEFEARRLELERQTAEEQKKVKIKQQKINIALAIGNALATTQPFIPAALIAAGIAAAKGAIELAAIQKQSFHGGGPTGRGSRAPDSTGHRPVGVVHEWEYVVPTGVMQHPAAKPHIAKLESMRRVMGYPYASGNVPFRSFAGGGATIGGADAGASVISVNTNATIELSDESIAAIASAVGEATEAGTERGAAAGLQSGVRQQERQEALESRTNI